MNGEENTNINFDWNNINVFFKYNIMKYRMRDKLWMREKFKKKS